jgi:large subunit ribosomal protein L25
MKEVALTASPRQSGTKGAARRVRAEGLIPGVVYGPEIEPISVAVTEADLRTAMRAAAGGISIFALNVDGDQKKVLLRDVQRHPVTSEVIHVDFHAISMDKPISIDMPIHYVGTPLGVKEGGIQQITMRELAISCLPANIPEQIEVDVSELNIGDSIHVSDLDIPNVDILAEERRTIVVISAPTVVKAASEEEEEEGVEGEEGEAAEGEEGAEGEAGEAKAEDGEKKEKKEKKDE